MVPVKVNPKSNLMSLLEELVIEASLSLKTNVLGTYMMLGIRDPNVPSWSSETNTQ